MVMTSASGSGSSRSSRRRSASARRARGAQVRIRTGDLHGQVALGRAHVCEAPVLAPRNLVRDSNIRPSSDAGHGRHKHFQPGRVRVERLEGRGDAGLVLALVLLLARAQRLGEVAPMPVEALVRHFKQAADVARLLLVQVEVCGGRVGVFPVRPAKEPRRHQRVEEVLAARGCSPRRPCNVSKSSGLLESSVKTSISTALSSALAAQKPRPTCKMCSALGGSVAMMNIPLPECGECRAALPAVTGSGTGAFRPSSRPGHRPLESSDYSSDVDLPRWLLFKAPRGIPARSVSVVEWP